MTDETNQLDKLQTCLMDIRAWTSSDFLLLNSDITEDIVFGPEYLRKPKTISLDGNALASSRNLGVTLIKTCHLPPTLSMFLGQDFYFNV